MILYIYFSESMYNFYIPCWHNLLQSFFLTSFKVSGKKLSDKKLIVSHRNWYFLTCQKLWENFREFLMHTENPWKVDKHHIFGCAHTKTAHKYTQETTKVKAISIATPDEILQKHLEISGFDHQQQQRVKWLTCLRWLWYSEGVKRISIDSFLEAHSCRGEASQVHCPA
jgi:hypothetical protein